LPEILKSPASDKGGRVLKGTGERKEEEEEKEKRKKRRRREKDCATEPQLLQLLNTFDASCFHPVFFLILASPLRAPV